MRNCRSLRVERIRPLPMEHSADSYFLGVLRECIDEEEISDDAGPRDIDWYIGLRAAQRFRSQYGRWPFGTSDEDILRRISETMLESWGISLDRVHSGIYSELVRSGGCEMHAMAAWLGGLGAQVCLKLCTSQYVPFNNSVLINGVSCSTHSWEL